MTALQNPGVPDANQAKGCLRWGEAEATARFIALSAIR